MGPISGDLAEKSETAMLRFLWKNGAAGDPVGVGGKFSGYTESWPRTFRFNCAESVEPGSAARAPDLALTDPLH